MPRFRLPTEAEWEYGSRGGYEHKLYPWEGPYLRNSKGCFLANFKPGRGDYIADNFEYTAPVDSYFPNDYGLYNMPGNVAEWCQDDYEETGYAYAHDLNPVYYDPRIKASDRVPGGQSGETVPQLASERYTVVVHGKTSVTSCQMVLVLMSLLIQQNLLSVSVV